LSEHKTSSSKIWNKVSVRDATHAKIKEIAEEENDFVYALVEKVFRKAYPVYFQNTEMKH